MEEMAIKKLKALPPVVASEEEQLEFARALFTTHSVKQWKQHQASKCDILCVYLRGNASDRWKTYLTDIFLQYY